MPTLPPTLPASRLVRSSPRPERLRLATRTTCKPAFTVIRVAIGATSAPMTRRGTIKPWSRVAVSFRLIRLIQPSRAKALAKIAFGSSPKPTGAWQRSCYRQNTRRQPCAPAFGLGRFAAWQRFTGLWKIGLKYNRIYGNKVIYSYILTLIYICLSSYICISKHRVIRWKLIQIPPRWQCKSAKRLQRH